MAIAWGVKVYPAVSWNFLGILYRLKAVLFTKPVSKIFTFTPLLSHPAGFRNQ